MKKEQTQIEKNLKLIAKTSFIVFFGVIISKILTYIYRIVIARYFGPEEYGLFNLGLMTLGIFTAIFSFGLNEGLLRYLSLYRGKKDKKRISYIIRFTGTFLIFSGIIASIIMFSLSNFISVNLFHNASLSMYIKIFSFLLPISLLTNTFLSIIRAYEQIKWFSFIQNILQNIARVFLIILFVLAGLKYSSNAIIFSYFISILSMLIAGYLFCKYKLSDILIKREVKLDIKRKIKADLFAYSWPIIFLGLISSILYWTDSFVIGHFRSVAEVGFFNAAVPIALILGISSEIFMQIFFPLITKEYSNNNINLIREVSKQIGKWVWIVNLPLFLITILFPGAIINILFGKEYLVAENALRFLAIGTFFGSITIISNNLLAMAGKTKVILFNLLFVAAANFLLDWMLVPIYGINGAAVASMFCTIVLGSLAVIETKVYLSIAPFRKKMLKIFFISLIPLLLVLVLREFVFINMLSLALLGSLFVLVYIILIYFTHCFDKNDLLILKSLKNKIVFNTKISYWQN